METSPTHTPSAPATGAAKPPQRRPRGALAKRERVRLIGAGLLGVLLTVFAVLNLDQVEVNWLLGSWSTPLIVVIVVSVLLGVAIDRLVLSRSRRRTRVDRKETHRGVPTSPPG